MGRARRGGLRAALPPALVQRARAARAVLARRPDPWLTEGFGQGESHGVRIRPLHHRDEAAWALAMRANHERMRPWWSLGEDDLDRLTDRLAFEAHMADWERRRRYGTGLCLAFVGPNGLVGELQMWHLQRGGKTCEVGLWLAPGQPRTVMRGVAGCMGYAADRMFGELGLERLDAPVATENRLPRSILELGGFEIDATIPRWRELHGELVDYDLFGLSPERYARARDRGWRLVGPWGPVGG